MIGKIYLWIIMVLNKKEGLMTNQKLRQALQAALDIESVMKVAAGGRPTSSGWAVAWCPTRSRRGTRTCPGAVQHKDKAKARALLQEAGYKGEPIRVLTSQEYKWMYDTAIVTKQQLEEIGMNVDLHRRRLRHPDPAAQQPHDLGRVDDRTGSGLRPDHAA